MNNTKNLLIICLLLLSFPALSQNGKHGPLTEMPYNRLIQSAGKVITYGDSSLENHSLDLCVLPDQAHIAVEDRYGIAIVNANTGSLVARWTYNDSKEWKNMMSTYSGITAVVYQNKTLVLWAASGKTNAEIMVAEWDGKKIANVSGMNPLTEPPSKTSPVPSLPNQVITHEENGVLYVYTVLNGQNKLVKLSMDNRSVVWSASTGAAPYGVCIIGHKAYVTNWAGPVATDTTRETAGVPWGSVYTNPVTGATNRGSLSVIDITNGNVEHEILLGLHSNSILSSPDQRFLYITNSNSDNISVVDVNKEAVIDSIRTGLFSGLTDFYGSSPNGLCINPSGTKLYVANGMDNAISVIKLGKNISAKGMGTTQTEGHIPTEAYPSGIILHKQHLYVTNLEAKGAGILSEAGEFKQTNGSTVNAYTIHKQLASLSIIPVPDKKTLAAYTAKVKELNLFFRLALVNLAPRKNAVPKPVPERIGEPSVFKHVIYIIKENKTYDQVFGDMASGNGDRRLNIYGENVTPNQHKLATDFLLLDNYFASGKSSAEGHQWTDAAMVSDYVEKNVRAWFRSYPHRQADALVYNKSGFIWNQALDHGKKVRIYGEACTTHNDTKMKWADIYQHYTANEPMLFRNTSTIARIRPIISPDYPDCDNFNITDQLRADIFIREFKALEQLPGDQVPELMVLSLPNDHTSGTSPGFPVPKAMVADNDLALGRIIQTITHSRFWDSTVVFVTEDDSQSGWDHVSSYRTICQVISPYTVRNKTIHTAYNQTSMVRTIEQILGIPPMNVIDATARPMFDCFQNVPVKYRYALIPNNIPLNEMNKSFAQLKGKAAYYAKLSQSTAFKDIDSGDDDEMNRILWFDAKGGEPYPGPLAAKKNK